MKKGKILIIVIGLFAALSLLCSTISSNLQAATYSKAAPKRAAVEKTTVKAAPKRMAVEKTTVKAAPKRATAK